MWGGGRLGHTSHISVAITPHPILLTCMKYVRGSSSLRCRRLVCNSNQQLIIHKHSQAPACLFHLIVFDKSAGDICRDDDDDGDDDGAMMRSCFTGDCACPGSQPVQPRVQSEVLLGRSPGKRAGRVEGHSGDFAFSAHLKHH